MLTSGLNKAWLLQMLSMANAGPNTNGSQVHQLGAMLTALQTFHLLTFSSYTT